MDDRHDAARDARSTPTPANPTDLHDRVLHLQRDGTARPSSASSTAAPWRPARAPASPTAGLAGGQPHVPGARHRRGRQHDARRRASPGRSTRPRRPTIIEPATDALPTGATFAFTSTERGSTFECKLDGGDLSSLHQPEELHRARRRLATRSTCARPMPVGNTDASPGQRHVDDRHGRADTSITSRAADADQRDRRRRSRSPPTARRDVRVPARRRRVGACTSPKSYSASSAGSHTFHVRATTRSATPTSPPPRSPGTSTRLRPTRASRRAPPTPPTPRARASPSRRPKAARRSSASSTAAAGLPARARRLTQA